MIGSKAIPTSGFMQFESYCSFLCHIYDIAENTIIPKIQIAVTMYPPITFLKDGMNRIIEGKKSHPGSAAVATHAVRVCERFRTRFVRFFLSICLVKLTKVAVTSIRANDTAHLS